MKKKKKSYMEDVYYVSCILCKFDYQKKYTM